MSALHRGALTRLLRSRVTHLVSAGIALSSLLALSLLASAAPATSSGYIAKLNNSADSVTTAQYFTCAAAAAGDRAVSTAIFQYALNDGPLYLTAADASSAGNPGGYRALLAQSSSTATPLACSRDGGAAFVFNGTSTYISTTNTSASPANYSVELWFKTTVAAGKLIGLGSSQTGSSGTYDRHLYIDSTGRVAFGAYNGATQVIVTPTVVTDGKWHHVVGTQSSTGGMILYLDGSQVAINTTYLTAQANTGYWRLGYDNLAGWPNPPTSYYFNGQMRYAAAYSTVLTPTQVKQDWAAGQ